MKLNSAFEEMEIVLNELNEQFETIKKNEVRAPQIEIDIIMSTMRRLYECLSHLNKQKPITDVEMPKETMAEVKEIFIEPEVKAITEKPIPVEVKTKDSKEEEPALLDEDKTSEKITSNFQEEIDILEENAKLEFEESKVEDTQPLPETAKAEKPSLLLQFEDDIFSVNDSAAQKAEDKSVVNKLSNTRIGNLKSAIGINDKFFFINELFSGNSQAYEDVIYTLNNFKRFEEALQYFSTLKYRYEWNTKTEAYHKLVHFLERKFVEINA